MPRYNHVFERIFVVIAAMALQFIFFFLPINWLNNHFRSVAFLAMVLATLIVVSIINRDMLPEAKITWVILVFLAPLFGSIVYLLFSSNRMTSEHKTHFQKITTQSIPYAHQNILPPEEFRALAGKYFGQCSYIHKLTGQVAYQNTAVTFYPLGETFFEALLEELKKAERYIFMEYFILSEGVIWDRLLAVLEEKVRAGVEVRLMFDSFGSIKNLPENYDQILRDKGIQCVSFIPFKPVVSAIHNNRDHRKITVIDGKVGFVGGVNLADEYANITHPFGHWKDTAVKLSGPAVKGLTLLFLQMFNSHQQQVDEFSNYILSDEQTEPASGLVMPFCDGPRPAYPDYISENIILTTLNQAERYVWITTPYLILNSRLRNAICNAAYRGVDVRIITPHIPDKWFIFQITRSNYQRLQKAGVHIYEYTPGFLHAKQFLCDDEIASVSTVNLDYRSLMHHFECGVWMYQPDCLDDIKADFEQLFSVSQNMEAYRQPWPLQLLCRLTHVFFPLL